MHDSTVTGGWPCRLGASTSAGRPSTGGGASAWTMAHTSGCSHQSGAATSRPAGPWPSKGGADGELPRRRRRSQAASTRAMAASRCSWACLVASREAVSAATASAWSRRAWPTVWAATHRRSAGGAAWDSRDQSTVAETAVSTQAMAPQAACRAAGAGSSCALPGAASPGAARMTLCESEANVPCEASRRCINASAAPERGMRSVRSSANALSVVPGRTPCAASAAVATRRRSGTATGRLLCFAGGAELGAAGGAGNRAACSAGAALCPSSVPPSCNRGCSVKEPLSRGAGPSPRSSLAVCSTCTSLGSVPSLPPLRLA